jgi:hypothetical protein
MTLVNNKATIVQRNPQLFASLTKKCKDTTWEYD